MSGSTSDMLQIDRLKQFLDNNVIEKSSYSDSNNYNQIKNKEKPSSGKLLQKRKYESIQESSESFLPSTMNQFSCDSLDKIVIYNNTNISNNCNNNNSIQWYVENGGNISYNFDSEEEDNTNQNNKKQNNIEDKIKNLFSNYQKSDEYINPDMPQLDIETVKQQFIEGVGIGKAALVLQKRITPAKPCYHLRNDLILTEEILNIFAEQSSQHSRQLYQKNFLDKFLAYMEIYDSNKYMDYIIHSKNQNQEEFMTFMLKNYESYNPPTTFIVNRLKSFGSDSLKKFADKIEFMENQYQTLLPKINKINMSTEERLNLTQLYMNKYRDRPCQVYYFQKCSDNRLYNLEQYSYNEQFVKYIGFDFQSLESYCMKVRKGFKSMYLKKSQAVRLLMLFSMIFANIEGSKKPVVSHSDIYYRHNSGKIICHPSTQEVYNQGNCIVLVFTINK